MILCCVLLEMLVVRGKLAEAWRKVRRSDRCENDVGGSTRNLGGRFAEGLYTPIWGEGLFQEPRQNVPHVPCLYPTVEFDIGIPHRPSTHDFTSARKQQGQ